MTAGSVHDLQTKAHLARDRRAPGAKGTTKARGGGAERRYNMISRGHCVRFVGLFLALLGFHTAEYDFFLQSETCGVVSVRIRFPRKSSKPYGKKNPKRLKQKMQRMRFNATARALLRHKASLGWHRWRCLQKYLHIPPGEEMAILYMKFFPTSGKGYVGQHRHGASGKSYSQSRMQRCKNKSSTYLYRAMGKHDAIHFVLAHVHEDDINELEVGGIAHFRTRAPHGYNLDAGGGNGPRHPDTVAKLRASLQSEPVRQRIRDGLARAEKAIGYKAKAAASLRTWAEGPEARRSLQDRMKRLRADPAVEAKRVANIRKTMSDPEVRAKIAVVRKKSVTLAFREKMRTINTARGQDPAFRAKLSSIQTVLANRPERKEKARQDMVRRQSDPAVRASMSLASTTTRALHRPEKERAELASALASSSTPEEAELAQMDHERLLHKREMKRGEAAPLTKEERLYNRKRRNALDPRRDEKKQKRQQAMRARWNDPAIRTQVSEKIKAASLANEENLLRRKILWDAYCRYLAVHGNLDVPVLYGATEATRDGIVGLTSALGKITNSIRSKWTHIKNDPMFAKWMHENGFRLSMRSALENEKRWRSFFEK